MQKEVTHMQKQFFLSSAITGALLLAASTQVAAQDCGSIDSDTTIATAVNGTCIIVAPSVLTFDENGSVANINDQDQVTSEDGVEVRNSDIAFSIINRGTIEGFAPLYIDNATGGELIENYGIIQSKLSSNGGGTSGIVFTNPTVFSTLINQATGIIKGDTAGVYLVSGAYVDEIYNYGLIAGTTNDQFGRGLGVFVGFNGNVGSLINMGVIEGAKTEFDGNFVDVSISRFGNSGMRLFENSQRGLDLYSGQDRLFLQGEVPASYNIIITSNEAYGQLNVVPDEGQTVEDTAGSTIFDISTLSQRFSASSFEAVMTGVSSTNFNNTSGTYLGAGWTLSEQNGRASVWDLTFQSTPLFDTQQSLENLRDATASVMLNAGLAVRSGLNFECSRFGDQNLCLRVGGRIESSSNDSSVDTTFASLAGAYRIDDTVRVGAYLDQKVANSSPNGFDYQPTVPALGAFVEYGQENGSGVQLRLAASRGSGELSMTRGLSLTDTEIGQGQTDIIASGLLGRVGYGVNLDNGTMVTPYFGFQRVGIRRDAYQETVGNDGQFPFAYDAYDMTETETVLGMTIEGDLQPKLSFRGDFGLETGGSRDVSTFSGSSSMSEFSEVSLDAIYAANDTRFFAGANLNFALNETTDFELGAMVREAAYGNETDVWTGASFIFRF